MICTCMLFHTEKENLQKVWLIFLSWKARLFFKWIISMQTVSPFHRVYLLYQICFVDICYFKARIANTHKKINFFYIFPYINMTLLQFSFPWNSWWRKKKVLVFIFFAQRNRFCPQVIYHFRIERDFFCNVFTFFILVVQKLIEMWDVRGKSAGIKDMLVHNTW